MGLASKALEIVGGGLFKEISETVQAYFPPDMSPEKKMELGMKLESIQGDNKLKLQALLNEEENNYNNRIMNMDGTAEQLRLIPWIGPFIILLRSIQRPIWGFATLWIDFMVFSSTWKLEKESQEMFCFLVVNVVVLVFLFGEKTFRNVAPLIERLIKR